MIREIWLRRSTAVVLAAVAAALLWGLWALKSQQALAEELVRFHVIAASDSAEDQALKLQVRDAVLEQTTLWLRDAKTQQEAEQILQQHLQEIETVAAQTVRAQGKADAVHVYLAPERYPTRDYATFSLPGGAYLSLRVVIGPGVGQNWWCVVFPPLCTTAATDESFSMLSQEQAALIRQSERGYVLRFKSIELWEKWIGNLS